MADILVQITDPVLFAMLAALLALDVLWRTDERLRGPWSAWLLMAAGLLLLGLDGLIERQASVPPWAPAALALLGATSLLLGLGGFAVATRGQETS